MKTIITPLLLTLAVAPAFAQSNKSIKAVTVTDVSALKSFGYLASYTVTFENTSSKTIYQINWTFNYYDNAGKLIKLEQES
jgi:hypothetical protein